MTVALIRFKQFRSCRRTCFLKVARVDEVFIKIPSERGIRDYQQLFKVAQSSSQDIRSIEDAERFERLALTIEAFPGFDQLIATSAEFVHYLAVHKLQYERLRVRRLWKSREQDLDCYGETSDRFLEP